VGIRTKEREGKKKMGVAVPTDLGIDGSDL